MRTIEIRVSEHEIMRRSLDHYYRGSVVSELGDLIAEKAGVKIGLTSVSFVDELNQIAEALGSGCYTGRIEQESMDRVYTFYPPDGGLPLAAQSPNEERHLNA